MLSVIGYNSLILLCTGQINILSTVTICGITHGTSTSGEMSILTQQDVWGILKIYCVRRGAKVVGIIPAGEKTYGAMIGS